MVGTQRAILMGLPIAWVLLLGSLPARSNTVINISIADSIPENMLKFDGVTLPNNHPAIYTFLDFTPVTLTPINNDPDDVVKAPVFIIQDTCSESHVGNLGCTFAFSITTADPTNTTNDVGTWKITTSIQALWFDITTNTIQTDTFNITDTVTVTDPVPLPGGLPLFTTGLGAIGLLGWRRKRKAQAVA